MNPLKTALLSIDNTKGFEDANLKELYVNGGEEAAKKTKTAIDMCKGYGIMIVNVFDSHPLGHVLFSSNYRNKKPYDGISYEEVLKWTEKNNEIGERAGFTLQELKCYLKSVRQETLWPDHCISESQGSCLMSPLKDSDFDYHIPKGEEIVNSGYSGFDHTNLDGLLKTKDIKTLILTGVATDYCVGQTALQALDKGYTVYVLSDAVRGVEESTTNKMLELFDKKGIRYVTISQLEKIFKL